MPVSGVPVSGVPAGAFVFVGFLPRAARERRALLADLAAERRALVAFETPHRLRASLADLAAALGGERAVTVARGLTKQFEEVWRGSLDDARARWAEIDPRGEFTLVVAGAPPAAVEVWDDTRVAAALAALQAEGVGAREAARRVAAASGRPARDVYRLWAHAG